MLSESEWLNNYQQQAQKTSYHETEKHNIISLWKVFDAISKKMNDHWHTLTLIHLAAVTQQMRNATT